MAGGSWDPSVCQVCGDAVGLVGQPDYDQEDSGYNAPAPRQERFVACGVCRFPVCQNCYEYERREGSRGCPHCRTAYPRAGGAGDDPEDELERYHQATSQPPSYMRSSDAASVTSEYYEQQQQQSQGRQQPYLSQGAKHGAGQYSPPQSVYSVDAGNAQFNDAYSVVDSEYTAAGDYPRTAPSTAQSTADQKLALTPAGKAPSPGRPPVAPSGARPTPFSGGVLVDPLPGKSKSVFEEEEARQPLSRKVPLPSSLINPYRLVIVLRLIITCVFLSWRFMNPAPDAVVLWALSVFCEVWFFASWILDQFPKWSPIKRETYKERLAIRFEPRPDSEEGNRLSCVDIFVSTVDPLKEPPITTANTLLSILAVDYPSEKIACYLSDDGGSMITFDCMAETAEFAKHWVPFCKKYKIEPRSPENYFLQKLDILAGKVDTQFVTDRREVKKMYEEFKVRINALVARKAPPEGWVMKDGTVWPGNKTRDHPGMIQVFLGPNGGPATDGEFLPRMVYVSREKRPGYAHHKKAGAMNSLIRVSAVLTNAPYILNLDCDHYINNSSAVRDAMCVMMDDNAGPKCCFVQFPQRFDGIDPNDRYANHNTVFFDINMCGLDGVQGPVYVGTGCVFRRAALYGHLPPKKQNEKPKGLINSCVAACCTSCGSCLTSCCSCCSRSGSGRRRFFGKRSGSTKALMGKNSFAEDPFAGGGGIVPPSSTAFTADGTDEASMEALAQYESKFGRSPVFVLSTFQEEGVSSSLGPVQSSAGSTLKEAINVISCGYEDQTAWGKEIGWIYGSVTEDILTGFKMQCRGWRSVYCMPKRPAFKGTAPINLSDRLQQVLRWALGSVEIFASRHCPIWYGWKANKLKFLQRMSYINTAVYPFTSFPLLIYCMLPAICLFTNRFIMPSIDIAAAFYFVGLFLSILATGLLEMRWSGVSMTEWWRNEQFWVIGGVSSHLFAVFQGLLKILAGIDTNFTVTAKQAGDEAGEYAELYLFKWTSLLIPPTFLVMINVLGIMSGVWQIINKGAASWGPVFGRLFFAFWVILHLYPFMKGLGGGSKRMPTLVIVWSVLLSSVFALLWSRVDPWTESITGPTECGYRC